MNSLLAHLTFKAAIPMLALLSTGVFAAGDEATHENRVVAECVSAAKAWLNSLDSDQRKLAQWPFDEDKRKIWGFLNNNSAVYVREEGLALENMTDVQRIRAHELIACGLSSQGYQKTASIMRVASMHRLLNDPTLKALRENRPDMPVVQIGPTWYWLAVFGEPSMTEPWQLQLEGHHLTHNLTFVAGEVAATPHFTGSRPAVIETGDFAGWSVLSHEKRRGFRLLTSLSAEQQRKAVVAKTVPEDIFTNPLTYKRIEPGQGLSAAEMTAAQRELLDELIDEFLGNLDDPIERDSLHKIKADGLDTLFFSWRGPVDDPAAAVYFLIHGPSVMIEFDNAWNRGENVSDPNHIHTVLRIPGGDFGEDYLAEHYRVASHHKPRQSPGMVLNPGEDLSALGEPHRISRPDEIALAAMQSDTKVRVSDDGDMIVFQPLGKAPQAGFVFYPGSEVSPAAYAHPLRQIAEQGYLVVAPYMPRYMAILASGKADEVISRFPEITHWAVGGHSLGGSAAGDFAAKYPDKVAGLAFWDSYPMAPIQVSEAQLQVAVIHRADASGTAPQSFLDAMPLLPVHAKQTAVVGATHMQFGNANKAPHRPEEFPAIAWQKTQQAAIEATVELLKSCCSNNP